MLVKHVNDTVFDVFVGKGWDNWCRFELVKTKDRRYLRKLGGTSIPQPTMLDLRKIYIKGQVNG